MVKNDWRTGDIYSATDANNVADAINALETKTDGYDETIQELTEEIANVDHDTNERIDNLKYIYVPLEEVGQPGGIPSLDQSGHIPSAQLNGDLINVEIDGGEDVRGLDNFIQNGIYRYQFGGRLSGIVIVSRDDTDSAQSAIRQTRFEGTDVLYRNGYQDPGQPVVWDDWKFDTSEDKFDKTGGKISGEVGIGRDPRSGYLLAVNGKTGGILFRVDYKEGEASGFQIGGESKTNGFYQKEGAIPGDKFDFAGQVVSSERFLSLIGYRSRIELPKNDTSGAASMTFAEGLNVDGQIFKFDVNEFITKGRVVFRGNSDTTSILAMEGDGETSGRFVGRSQNTSMRSSDDSTYQANKTLFLVGEDIVLKSLDQGGKVYYTREGNDPGSLRNDEEVANLGDLKTLKDPANRNGIYPIVESLRRPIPINATANQLFAFDSADGISQRVTRARLISGEMKIEGQTITIPHTVSGGGLITTGAIVGDINLIKYHNGASVRIEYKPVDSSVLSTLSLTVTAFDKNGNQVVNGSPEAVRLHIEYQGNITTPFNWLQVIVFYTPLKTPDNNIHGTYDKDGRLYEYNRVGLRNTPLILGNTGVSLAETVPMPIFGRVTQNSGDKQFKAIHNTAGLPMEVRVLKNYLYGIVGRGTGYEPRKNNWKLCRLQSGSDAVADSNFKWRFPRTSRQDSFTDKTLILETDLVNRLFIPCNQIIEVDTGQPISEFDTLMPRFKYLNKRNQYSAYAMGLEEGSASVFLDLEIRTWKEIKGRKFYSAPLWIRITVHARCITHNGNMMPFTSYSFYEK